MVNEKLGIRFRDFIAKVENETQYARSEVLYGLISMLHDKIDNQSNKRALEFWVNNKQFFIQMVEGYDIETHNPTMI